MTDALTDYCAVVRGEPFEWGRPRRDCLRLLGGWRAVLTGSDPTEAWHYATAEEAADLLLSLGGHSAAISSVMGDPVAENGPAPRRGDIGLFRGAHLVTGVICTGQMWVAKPQRGGVSYLRVQPSLYWAMGFQMEPTP